MSKVVNRKIVTPRGRTHKCIPFLNFFRSIWSSICPPKQDESDTQSTNSEILYSSNVTSRISNISTLSDQTCLESENYPSNYISSTTPCSHYHYETLGCSSQVIFQTSSTESSNRKNLVGKCCRAPICEILSENIQILNYFGKKSIEWERGECYCEECSSTQGVSHTDTYHYDADLPNLYQDTLKDSKMIAGKPYSWSRFAVKLKPEEAAVASKWHIAYHGTTKEAAKLILMDRHLKVPDSKKVHVRPYHTHSSFFFTTPSVKYASFVTYATPFKLSNRDNWWQVIIEVRQKPGSYSLHPQTLIQGHYTIDPCLGNNVLAWKSSEPANIFVSALLVRHFSGKKSLSGTEVGMPSNRLGLGIVWWQPWEGTCPVMMKFDLPNQRLKGRCGCKQCENKKNRP